MPVTINGTNTPTAGGVVYGDGGSYATTSAGTSGQLLTSAGAGVPTWTTPVVPGATAQYSIVGQPQVGSGSTTAFTISGLASGLVYNNNFNGIYAGGSGTDRSFTSVFWSSYYNCWVALGLSTSSSLYGIFVSPDGLTWRCILQNVQSATGAAAINPQGQSAMPVLAVDDSNGRFFIMVPNSSNGTIRIYYSSITSTQALTGGWTQGLSYTASRLGGLMYCKMSSTAASGIVAVFTDDSNICYIHTCSAGATTFTNRVTMGLPSASVGWGIYQENGAIAVPIGTRSYMAYTLSGNITTGWTSTSSLPTTVQDNRQSAVGNGYITYISGGDIYWSTNGTTWTIQAISGNTLSGITYTGSTWLAWDSVAMYTSSTAAPNSTWSLYSGGVNILKYPNLGTIWARRVVA